jgi:hypothetical protein
MSESKISRQKLSSAVPQGKAGYADASIHTFGGRGSPLS